MTEIFAHRGCHAVAAENTIGAFVEARAAGADGVELDVRRTADGALVVSHDDEISGVGSISALPCRALPTSVPTLAEAIGACGDLTVNVEIKNSPGDPGYDPTGSLAHAVVDALGELDRRGAVIVSSFDLPTCDAVHSVDPAVPVGWLLDWRADPAPAVATAAAHALNAIHPFVARVDGDLVAAARAVGLSVNVWTVNDPSEMVRLSALGVDVIITDDVPLALVTLTRGDKRPDGADTDLT